MTIASLLLACAPGSNPFDYGLSDEDRAVLERVKVREFSRWDLQTNPGRSIRGGHFTTSDSGILKTYTRVTAIEFRNDSPFDVSDITGHITLTTEDGTELGIVPFSAEGYVYAGRTIELKVRSSEVTGKGIRAEIVIEGVHVWG
jgi:hypothetical protein